MIRKHGISNVTCIILPLKPFARATGLSEQTEKSMGKPLWTHPTLEWVMQPPFLPCFPMDQPGSKPNSTPHGLIATPDPSGDVYQEGIALQQTLLHCWLVHLPQGRQEPRIWLSGGLENPTSGYKLYARNGDTGDNAPRRSGDEGMEPGPNWKVII